MTKNNLTVVISAYNEEKKIADCLKSVAFVDEIILVDNSSTDNTVEIAKKYTSHIYSRPNNLMLNVNKNFGFTKAPGEWILSLDADERVTQELQDEIQALLAAPPDDVNGYWIPRKNIIFGKWIEHTGWYPDYQLRLFRKSKGVFAQKHVHEMIDLEGKTEHLRHDLLHYNFETIAQFVHKHVSIYAPNEADVLMEKGYVYNWMDALRMPFREFLSRFFARAGYKDGIHGLALSMLMGFYHFIIFMLIWERKGFVDQNENVLSGLRTEYPTMKKEIEHWLQAGNVESAKNPLSRMMKKVLHKSGITSL